MSKAPDPPFTLEAVAAELRELLLIQAGHISHIAGEEAATAFLGFKCPLSPMDEPPSGTNEKVDLSRFPVWEFIRLAYDYAFQVGSWWLYDTSVDFDAQAFAYSATEYASWGRLSPFKESNSKIRHVLDLASARLRLSGEENEEKLTVRDLSLLANMSEAAVRNSLSTMKLSSPLDADAAASWLKDRKGFVPNRTEIDRRFDWDIHTTWELNAKRLQTGLRTILRDLGLTPETAAKKANIPLEEVLNLLGEHSPVPPDVENLRRLGTVLKADIPYFIGQAIETVLRRLS